MPGRSQPATTRAASRARFAGAAHLAAMRVCANASRGSRASSSTPGLRTCASSRGRIFAAAGNPGNDLDFRAGGVAGPLVAGQSAGRACPPALRETARWTPPQLTPPDDDDRINNSAAVQFHLRFSAGWRWTAQPAPSAIDRYVTHPRYRPAPQSGAGGRPDSGAPSPTPWAPRSTRSSPIPRTAASSPARSPTILMPTACEVPDPQNPAPRHTNPQRHRWERRAWAKATA